MTETKCSVFIATSLDGFIARKDGSIDWLMKANAKMPEGEDGGYQSFISTVNALVMGRHSFEKILSFDTWPYGNLPVVVMSSQPVAIPEHLKKTVTVSWETPTELVKRLSTIGLKHLYIDGGITIQGFLAENLICELTVTVIPVLLGSGRPLFGSLNNDMDMELLETKHLGADMVQLRYHHSLCRCGLSN